MMQEQFQALERGDLETVIRLNAVLFRRPWFNTLAGLKLWKDRNRLTAALRDPAAILHDYRQLFGPGFAANTDHCRRIQSPTLIVGGTNDCYFDRQTLEETRDLIPNARLHLVERETHMLPLENPQAIRKALSHEAW
jgi:pimeloyl-ACP methyl ester carboxylesterase